MNDDYYWVPLAFFTLLAVSIINYGLGFSTGETTGRNKGISYCMEQPKNCAIEYTYLKLKEKSK